MTTQIEERQRMNIFAALTSENTVKGLLGSVTSVGGAILTICGYISAIGGAIAVLIGLYVAIQSVRNAKLDTQIKTAELARLTNEHKKALQD